MDVIDKDSDGATVRLSRDELYMLIQGVSTLCDGGPLPDDWEFETILGWDRATYRRLLDQISEA